MPNATLLSPHDLADYLGVPVKTIYNWRTEKKGPRGVKVGRHLRFRSTDVESWLEENADEPGR
jgi:excisionase family DNA binding protein